jgi:uncharacterized protein YndB with AHSA1/START domain
MTEKSHSPVQPGPLNVSRVFNAPRATVFKAWSATEHVARWFCPTDYSVPEAKVEMRVGGPFEVCMRSPGGMEHWTRGTFIEVSPSDRLVLDLHVEGPGGARLFQAWTEATFSLVPGGTQLDVVQTYTFDQPEIAAPMVQGAGLGWSQTLDKLEAEIARIAAEGAVKRSVVHGAFTIERTYDATPAQVYRALSDPLAKGKWFGGDPGLWASLERHMDFRVGGSERAKGRWQSGVVTTFDALYLDIVPEERIVYTYEMHIDERKISISLATMQIVAAGDRRTTLKVTEQGAFLDGYDDAGSREHGTGYLLDRLGTTL